MEEVVLQRFPIRLQQFLKLMGLVGTGGEVKHLLDEGRIWVNGKRETHRGRQLYPGDEVLFRHGRVVLRFRVQKDGP
ncbi:MAG: RNA-binding S4 domain-containing protein [Bacillota bacterium]|nr:RNA-binding S4 domain-containing protein [Bacillota bacterium]